MQGDGAWEPRTRSCRRSSLKASGSSNSTDDQVRLSASNGLDAAGQPCLRCKTSSGNTAEHSQDSKGSSSDRSSLAEDLFEAQGNGTPASHPRGEPAASVSPDSNLGLMLLVHVWPTTCNSLQRWRVCNQLWLAGRPAQTWTWSPAVWIPTK